MGNFRIFKSATFVLVSVFGTLLSQSALDRAAASALPDPVVRDLVSETLIRGLEAAEVKPVPPTSPACLLIAGVQGADGTLVVSPAARLFTVQGDIQQETMRELSVKFGASGLKVGQQLVTLTSDLNWTGQPGGAILTLGFERGLFSGFFNGAPHFKDVVKIARVGDGLCVAA